jgi:hypothetical protein
VYARASATSTTTSTAARPVNAFGRVATVRLVVPAATVRFAAPGRSRRTEVVVRAGLIRVVVVSRIRTRVVGREAPAVRRAAGPCPLGARRCVIGCPPWPWSVTFDPNLCPDFGMPQLHDPMMGCYAER